MTYCIRSMFDKYIKYNYFWEHNFLIMYAEKMYKDTKYNIIYKFIAYKKNQIDCISISLCFLSCIPNNNNYYNNKYYFQST